MATGKSGLFLLAFCGVLLGACGNGELKQKIGKKDVVVPVIQLETETVRVPHDYICDIQARKNVEIRARVQGYLEQIYVDEGQEVVKGQPLFRISAHEYKEHVSRAEANLKRAIAEGKAANLEVDRLRIMVEKEIISSTELEVAKARKDASESAVAEARSVLQNAQINLNYTYIKAPFSGTVDRIPFKIGSLINSGTLLTTVSDVSEVFAYYNLTENEYLQFARNKLNGLGKFNDKPAVSLVLSDGTEYSETGFVETMDGDFEPGTGSISFRARFPNPSKLLKHGASGKVRMIEQLENVVLVPQKSTFEIQDKNYVFLLGENNTAVAHSFTPAMRYQLFYVAEGLEAGQTIVYEGLQSIRDGNTINPKMVQADSVLVSLNNL
ncbi:efflux RND transporter periplasmic adaptor subunit [uncultured Imperialibacter sp.]|uniref:efflux RND transporter periplasmic adaptor subunit n=1 Tax=uncultured Imperialibacter sp. TaxID=1672639 RepID=UPI0030DB2388|tara:strand:- start:22548 stop:23693 length:1146 start_codon:yes stop_codon:yes gene_type:complete